MTDQLPRTIPTDPAEQEAQMPEWVKVEAAKACGRGKLYSIMPESIDPSFDTDWWNHALTIWQWMPAPVDPDLLMAREVCAGIMTGDARAYRTGVLDTGTCMQVALAMAKRVREAGK